MQKKICNFCKKEIFDIPKFKIKRCDALFIGIDMTGFHNLDVCMDCLRKLKKQKGSDKQ